MAVAIFALVATVATAGCGLGPGEGLGGVRLTVTRDYGRTSLLERQVGDVTEADTVMRVLEGNATIATRYGGGFVQSIDGLEAQERFGRSSDWFFYVDGVESTVGAADYSLRGGEAIWWDYRDWGVTMSVPAVVGSWPQPLAGGYEGHRHPVVVECLGGGEACATARAKLGAEGVALAAGSPATAIRVLVGPWGRVRRDPAAAQIEAGPRHSGVFADFQPAGRGYVMRGLGNGGEVVTSFGPGAGLIAATRRGSEPPVWVVTGSGAEGVGGAASRLDAADLRDHYAVAVENGRGEALPLR